MTAGVLIVVIVVVGGGGGGGRDFLKQCIKQLEALGEI